MKNDTADHLDIERDHIPCQFMVADCNRRSAESAAGVFHYRKSFAHDVIGRFSFLETIFEFLCFRLELVFGKLLIGNFELVYFIDQRAQPFHIAAGFTPENRF